jgi:hypothetical protein
MSSLPKIWGKQTVQQIETNSESSKNQRTDVYYL